MRKPTEARLRVLAEVGDHRVRRTGAGWVVCSQPAAATDIRALSAARADGWLSTDREPADPIESVPVTLTAEGRAVLARYWPDWRPRDERA